MIPKGWYFCAESTEIKCAQVVAKQLFGQRLVFWRTESGKLNVSHAVCPHLGSDLGKLGRVKGENLQCFSHDYTYNNNGDCVATGFRELPLCSKNVLRCYPVREKNGFVLVWYDAKNSEPEWHIPDDIFNVPSSKYVRSNFEFKVALEVLNEDNFDVGHLYKWHHVHDVKSSPVVCAGPSISISHHFRRHSILVKKPLKPPLAFLTKEIRSCYSSTLYGHGLTNSFIEIFNLGIRLHDLIWCTPIDAKTTMYTTFVRLVTPPQRSLPRRCLDALIFRACVRRLRQEHKHEGHGFWERQTKVENPILTATESKLIHPYRQWCQQFQ